MNNDKIYQPQFELGCQLPIIQNTVIASQQEPCSLGSVEKSCHCLKTSSHANTQASTLQQTTPLTNLSHLSLISVTYLISTHLYLNISYHHIIISSYRLNRSSGHTFKRIIKLHVSYRLWTTDYWIRIISTPHIMFHELDGVTLMVSPCISKVWPRYIMESWPGHSEFQNQKHQRIMAKRRSQSFWKQSPYTFMSSQHVNCLLTSQPKKKQLSTVPLKTGIGIGIWEHFKLQPPHKYLSGRLKHYVLEKSNWNLVCVEVMMSRTWRLFMTPYRITE